MGYYTKDGTPHINDRPAILDDDYTESALGKAMAGVLTCWRCPECNAHLAPSGICLNACHLGKQGQANFAAHMAQALPKRGGFGR